MNKKNLNKRVALFLIAGFSISGAFAQKSLELQSVKRTKYDITAQYDSGISPKTEEFIYKYKVKIEIEMRKVIGFAPEVLAAGDPESPLMNLTADALISMAEALTKSKVDLSIINNGGLRNSLRKGPITVRNMYEIFPFENRIVVVSMRGKDLRGIFEYMSKKGIGGIGGASLVIKESQIGKVTIGGKLLNDDAVYQVATIDYLAEGNDGLINFKQSYNRIDTKVLLRTGMINFIKGETKKKKEITAKNDHRVVVEN